MDKLTLMERFADPELMQQMDTGDKVVAALIVTLLGMIITFLVLTLLWGLIGIMTRILDRPKKEQQPVAPVATPMSSIEATQDDDDDDALIAVISAAIAASIQRPIQTIVVKNIKRTTDRMPAWASVAKHEQLDSRRI